MDPWLLLAGFVAGGAALALEPAACAVPALLVVVLLARRAHGAAPRWLLVVGMSLCAGHCWRARAALGESERRYGEALAALPVPRRCVVEGTVLRSPVVIRADAPARSPPPGARIDLAIEASRCDEERAVPVQLPEGMRVRLFGVREDLRRGDRVDAVVSLAPVHLFANPAQLDARARLSLSDVVASGSAVGVHLLERERFGLGYMDAARAHVRRRIEETYPASVSPFARALVLGETDLPEDERASFRVSGLSHLLAVSGTHLVFAVVVVARGLRALLALWPALAGRMDPGRIAAALSAIFAWAYADFAGGGGSARRAAAMLSFAMLARAAARRPSVRRCFAWSLLAGLVFHPLALFDLSFALSLAATAGLLSLYEPSASREAAPAWMWRPALATTAAMLACAPLVLTMSPTLPLLGVVANLIAAPIGELLALPLALLHALAWWWPALEQGLATLAAGALWMVRAVAHGTRDISWGAIALPPPDARQLATLAAALVAWRLAATRAERRGWLALGLLLLLFFEIDLRRGGAPKDLLRVTVLDVGQGDALLVDLPDGALMMIDGGGLVGSSIDMWERVLEPELRARRRTRIDVLVSSHPHPDHYDGLIGALAAIEVGAVWTSGLERAVTDGPASLVAAFDAAQVRGVPIVTAETLCAGPHRFGSAEVRVLAPCPSFDAARSANDNSLVLHVAFGRNAALLVGDAEAAEEAGLLEEPELLRADLLKVGHHGSRTSSGQAFVAAVAPDVAVISCGVRNRFGHPHDVALHNLSAAGAALWRTDRHGAVTWWSDGEAQGVTGVIGEGRLP